MISPTPVRKGLMHFVTIAAVVILALSPSCKKDKKPNDGGSGVVETPAAITTMLNTSNTAAVQYQEALQAGGDSLDAFLAMGKWLITQPDVERATAFGLNIMNVYYKNGMMNIINVIHTDQDGNAYTRGGADGRADSDGSDGNKLAFRNLMRSAGDDHIITNQNALIICPFESDFYPYPANYPFLPKFTQGKHKLQATYIKDRDVTLSVLNTFKDYGLIMINTHGLPQGLMIKHKIDKLDIPHPPESTIYTEDFVREMFTDLNGMPIERFQNGDLILCVSLVKRTNTNAVFVSERTVVTDKYIKTLPGLDKAVVFGNFCYSGWTAPHPLAGNMADAFKSIGAISYYGYSYEDGTAGAVDNIFAKHMEDTLLTSLLSGDSTGVAHLNNNEFIHSNAEQERDNPEEIPITQDMTREGLSFKAYKPAPNEPLFFRHHDDVRYKYGCGSFTDPRDGEVYALACIGNQTWMAENLRYAGGGAGMCYDNSSVNCDKYGRLYTITEVTGLTASDANPSGVKGICPEGWHVPSNAEWEELIAFCGGEEEAIKKLRTTADWPQPNNNTDAFGFQLLPSGSYVLQVNNGNFQFSGLGTTNAIWSASATAGNASFFALNMMDLQPYSPPSNIVWKFSCRCLKD